MSCGYLRQGCGGTLAGSSGCERHLRRDWAEPQRRNRVALLFWSRSDVRRRVGALIGLALLIAVSGGASLAALAGARRSATALERLRVRTKAADSAVFGTPEQMKVAVSDPHVAASLGVAFVAVASVDDPNLFPFGAPDSSALGRTIERPLILAGRRADPARPTRLSFPKGSRAGCTKASAIRCGSCR